MKFTRLLFAVATGLMTALLSGCVDVEYLGNVYPPTANVLMCFDARELPPGVIKMGEATATLDDEDELFVGSDAVNAKLQEKARSVGADFILITSNQRVVTGVRNYNNYSTSYREEEKYKRERGQELYKNVKRDQSKVEGWQTTSTSQGSYNTTARVVHAVFFKRVTTAADPVAATPPAPAK